MRWNSSSEIWKASVRVFSAFRAVMFPHAWSKEELRALLGAVDRANPTGKRDYAIYLLVIQTGPRAADIRALKLGDIHWEERKIRLTTSKNSRNAEFPLLETTGWAMIDYLRHGRPKTDCDRVFVRHITALLEARRDWTSR